MKKERQKDRDKQSGRWQREAAGEAEGAKGKETESDKAKE